MKYLTLTLTAVGLLASTSFAAHANEAMELSTKDKTVSEVRAYDYEFNRDEQCQGYALGVKRLGYDNPCGEKAKPLTMKKVDILSEYVVYFDFDKANIRESDQAILDQAAREITRFHPGEVRIAGYTDTRGSMAYNEKLSAKRAANVSDYLTNLGVNNNVVDEEAMGETNLAIATADEVRAQPNRRVVVQFIR